MAFKIDKKIVGYKVVNKTGEENKKLEDIKPEDRVIEILTSPSVEEIVQISEQVKRTPTLYGLTVKIKPPTYKHAYYLTLNHIEIKGKRFPFEVFINTQDSTHYQWVSILTRMVSAVFRKGGDIGFIVENFKSIADPAGCYWGLVRNKRLLTTANMHKKRLYNSIIEEIGCILEDWLFDLEEYNSLTDCKEFAQNEPYIPSNNLPVGKTCPECGLDTMYMMDGCMTCICGYSKCG